jgi:glycosyltransferase involved in cell wall biosynthesis
MNILLHSCVFYPSIGGVETISRTMATHMCQMGHSVRVVTETSLGAAAELESESYCIIRNPSFSRRTQLVKESDLVFSNGASMGMFFYAKVLGKPFVWTHNGYQVSCIDGLGWAYGEASPITPAASVFFHLRRSGLLRGAVETLKLFLRRAIARRVDLNVAATQWVAFRQPLPNQVQLYTPYELSSFEYDIQIGEKHEYAFVFVGRLVTEKGVKTLLMAFYLFLQNNPGFSGRLLIVGDGPEKTSLERFSRDLGIVERTDFVGRMTGLELLLQIKKAPIAIVPSEWEEPMGGVALELLAAGRCLIVSKRGGMAECMGNASLTFDNGDPNSLCQCMESLVFDPEIRNQLRSKAPSMLAAFCPRELTVRYLTEFERIIKRM